MVSGSASKPCWQWFKSSPTYFPPSDPIQYYWQWFKSVRDPFLFGERRGQFEVSGFSLCGQDPTHLGQHQSFRSWLTPSGSRTGRRHQPSRGVERRVIRDRCHHPPWWFECGTTYRGVLEEERAGSHLHQSPRLILRTSSISALLSTRLLRKVSRTHLYPSYEPLQYLLFFPHGCFGRFPRLTSTRPPYQRVTQQEYYRQRLLSEPRFGLLGRLLNEYVVDMFSSMEDNRVNYVRQQVQSRIAVRHKLDETIYGKPEDAAKADCRWTGCR